MVLLADRNPVHGPVDFDWSVSFFEPEQMGASEEVAFLWSSRGEK